VDGSFDADAGVAVTCSVWRACIPSEYVANEPSALVDRICEPCPEGSFSSFADQSQCFPWTACETGQEVEAGTATTDRVCAAGIDFGLVPEFTGITDIAANQHRVYTIGTVEGSSDAPDVVVFDTAGTKLGSWTFAPEPHVAQGVATDSAGAVYVAGARWDQEDLPSHFLRKVEESGTELWETSLGVASVEQSVELEIGPDGSLYVAYASYNQDLSLRSYLVSRYTDGGQRLWATETPGKVYDKRHDFLAVDGDGNAYVTGDENAGFPALRLTSDGVIDDSWSPEESGITSSYAVASGGHYVDVAGEVGELGSAGHFFRTVRYDLSGKVAWHYDFETTYAAALVEDPDGSLYLIGFYSGFGTNVLTKLSSEGAWLGQRLSEGLIAGAWGDRLYVAGSYYVDQKSYGRVLPLPFD
jgi:TNFR/NGFR cysteine-rich protein